MEILYIFTQLVIFHDLRPDFQWFVLIRIQILIELIDAQFMETQQFLTLNQPDNYRKPKKNYYWFTLSPSLVSKTSSNQMLVTVLYSIAPKTILSFLKFEPVLGPHTGILLLDTIYNTNYK